MNISSGKMAFGTFNNNQDYSSYNINKKAKNIYCNKNKCIPRKHVNSQSEMLLFNRYNISNYYDNLNTKNLDNLNTKNLNINLITKLDLTDVPVIQSNILGKPIISPTPLSTTVIPYIVYTIDPSGNLFGNTVCGINNYEHYLVYNPPPNPNSK